MTDTQKFSGTALSTGNYPDAIDVQVTAAKIAADLVNTSYGSQTGYITFSASDATADREGFRITTSGTVAQLGFFGATPVSKQTTAASAAGGTYTSNEQTLINDIHTALKNLGLMT